ncbi:cyclophilin-like fold protein [Paenibacillus ihuae]|uniref:cyclophilin-like fold protein n=1 Tax=Paenibacillus ihuae TaxID=1232431 RepID=UPI0006D56137|nr:cyclophilin-like fold protein [Paenibacillus ihuae]
MKVRITLPAGEATGEIEDTAPGRDLISLLPLTLDMYDLFAREKPGLLPRELDGVTETMLTYTVGQIPYWQPSHDIVFCFADDENNNEIPEPGIVHLGTITSGLEHIASAGDSFKLTIERA